MRYPNEIIKYDGIVFENGDKDFKANHPFVIAGMDENYYYGFYMTSQLKHIYKYTKVRNEFFFNFKYYEPKSNDDYVIDNNLSSLIVASHALQVPRSEIGDYQSVGFIRERAKFKVIYRWLFYQNEIVDQKEPFYDEMFRALHVNENFKLAPEYVRLLMIAQDEEMKEEILIQKDYAKRARIRRNEVLRIDKENEVRKSKGLKLLAYPERVYLVNTINDELKKVNGRQEQFMDEEQMKEQLILLKKEILEQTTKQEVHQGRRVA